VEKLAEECGFDEVIPKLWIDKVDAVMPDVGYHIRWYAVWMEVAEGISLENLLRMALPTPSIEAERMEDMFNDKLNKTQVSIPSPCSLSSLAAPSASITAAAAGLLSGHTQHQHAACSMLTVYDMLVSCD
jgi:hypothetical protein